MNNKETAWAKAYLVRLTAAVDHDGMESFVVEVIGSSVDRMRNLIQKAWSHHPKNEWSL